ncbi:MAG: hypothetical protein DRJ32_03800 [Thermoprotei archaeon]|nr:MAG: hypothetical protein DRJ32_03800 [Thermoprotei archaeon]HDD63618.1 hypothetical protein [Thermoprotei archaeon]
MNPMLPLLTLLGGSVATPLVGMFSRKIRFEKIRDAWAILAFLVTTCYFSYLIYSGKLPLYYAVKLEPSWASIEIRIDSFSAYMSLIFSFLGLMVSIYSVGYMSGETGLDEYYALLLTLVAGMIGVTMANDLFTLYVFWELMCISSYTLVSFRKHRWEAVEAGFKYLVMSTIGSLIALYSISLLYGIAGTLNFSELSQIISSGAESISTSTLYFIIAMIIAGFGVTAAIVPFHTWLPDAHPAAPSSISAMLSGVVIKTGAYVIFRSLYAVFFPTEFLYGHILILFGLLTMSVANIMVILQKDIKRFLAYSSIANMGYIILGLGVSTYIAHFYPSDIAAVSLALLGSLFHVLNHAVGKGLLFLGAGCFIKQAKTRNIAKLEGIGRKMPVSAVSFSVGLLNLAGVPPMSGFWSKFFIIIAMLSHPKDTLLHTSTIVFVVNILVAAGYYLWLLQRITLRKPGEQLSKIREVSPSMVIPVAILACICILLTLFIAPVLDLISGPVEALIGYLHKPEAIGGV